MAGYFDQWGNLPGIQAITETYENEFRWGPAGLGLITGGTINAAAIDPGNTPNYELRRGLILGQKTADATWTNYAATNTDGSEVACGVLLTGLRMQQILTGQTQGKFYGILVGGPIKSSVLIGLDNQARADMAGAFRFDDQPFNLPGAGWFPWKRFQTKTANYQVTVGDNFSLFDNVGATGEVDFTLPAIQNGLSFGFRVQANQTVKVISNEGANLVGFNNAAASSVAFLTGGAKVGGLFKIYSNPAGTFWIVETASAGANTVTTA